MNTMIILRIYKLISATIQSLTSPLTPSFIPTLSMTPLSLPLPLPPSPLSPSPPPSFLHSHPFYHLSLSFPPSFLPLCRVRLCTHVVVVPRYSLLMWKYSDTPNHRHQDHEDQPGNMTKSCATTTDQGCPHVLSLSSRMHQVTRAKSRPQDDTISSTETSLEDEWTDVETRVRGFISSNGYLNLCSCVYHVHAVCSCHRGTSMVSTSSHTHQGIKVV